MGDLFFLVTKRLCHLYNGRYNSFADQSVFCLGFLVTISKDHGEAILIL